MNRPIQLPNPLDLQRIYLLLDSEFSPSAGSLTSAPSTSQGISSPLRNVAQEKEKKRRLSQASTSSLLPSTQQDSGLYPISIHHLSSFCKQKTKSQASSQVSKKTTTLSPFQDSKKITALLSTTPFQALSLLSHQPSTSSSQTLLSSQTSIKTKSQASAQISKKTTSQTPLPHPLKKTKSQTSSQVSKKTTSQTPLPHPLKKTKSQTSSQVSKKTTSSSSPQPSITSFILEDILEKNYQDTLASYGEATQTAVKFIKSEPVSTQSFHSKRRKPSLECNLPRSIRKEKSSIDPKEDILLIACRQSELYPESTDQVDVNMTNNEDNFFPVTTNQEDANITKTDTTIDEEDSLSGLIKQEPIDENYIINSPLSLKAISSIMAEVDRYEDIISVPATDEELPFQRLSFDSKWSLS